MGAEVTRFLSGYPPDVRELSLRVRDLLLDALPGISERVQSSGWKSIAYGVGPKIADIVCVLAPQRSYVNLGFFAGVDLPDPAGLLEGTGKSHRHVKISRPADLEKPEPRALLEAALAARSR